LPRKIRDLLRDLKGAGFREIPGAGKGSHRKLVHPKFSGAVTVSGRLGNDVKHYQEREITSAIEIVTK
jgi:predicted RNA binding protein YcfA (HicA-like mRNA interferase family)